MAVLSCEIDDAYCEEDLDGYADYTVVYRVVTDIVNGPETVRQHPALPTRVSSYAVLAETNANAVFKGKSIKFQGKEESRKIWLVTVKFSDNPEKGSKKDPEDPPGNPLNDPAVIETFAIKDKEAYLIDWQGRMLASSAKEPYDPVQERDATRYMLRITRNQDDVDQAFYAAYRDAINEDTFFGCDPYTVKVETPGAIQVLWAGPLKYYKVVWEFAIRSGETINGVKDDWMNHLYDYGMYKLVGAAPNQKLVQLKDLHGNFLTSPRLLDGAGAVLAVDLNPVQIVADGFQAYVSQPFGLLNLPQSF